MNTSINSTQRMDTLDIFLTFSFIFIFQLLSFLHLFFLFSFQYCSFLGVNRDISMVNQFCQNKLMIFLFQWSKIYWRERRKVIFVSFLSLLLFYCQCLEHLFVDRRVNFYFFWETKLDQRICL